MPYLTLGRIMNTEETAALIVYVAALLALTCMFHRRYHCIRASLFTGFGAAFLATGVLSALGPTPFRPAEYVAGFVWFGFTPAMVGAFLSAMMGAAIQFRK